MKGEIARWLSPNLLDDLRDIPGYAWMGVRPNLSSVREPGKQILYLAEPRATWNDVYMEVESQLAQYDLILTFDKRLLQIAPQARPFISGTSWVPRTLAEKNGQGSLLSQKVGLQDAHISFLCGDKLATPEHKFRRKVFSAQQRLERNGHRRLQFWRSSQGGQIPPAIQGRNPIFQGGKENLHQPFCFSIIIENSTEENYFSEKLTDCLLCKTIPLYRGCRNIGTFFNMAGIFTFDTLEQLEERLLSCTPERYRELESIVEDNYRKAMTFGYFLDERLRQSLLDNL